VNAARVPGATALLAIAVVAATSLLVVDNRVARSTLDRTSSWRESVATVRNNSVLARLRDEQRRPTEAATGCRRTPRMTTRSIRCSSPARPRWTGSKSCAAPTSAS
jgi:hypothetical protein